MGGICLGRVRARKPLFSSCFLKLMNDETDPQNTHSHHPTPTPPSTIHPLRTFLISRHASPPPASAPRPPPFPPYALALAAKRVGHAGCQFDGAPSLRCFTLSKLGSASTVTPAVPCFSPFHSTRGWTWTRGLTSTTTETEMATPLPHQPLPQVGGIMSNGLPDPDSLLTPGGTPFDAINGVLNGLNPGSCLSLLPASTMPASRSSCRGKEPLMATSTTGRLSSK